MNSKLNRYRILMILIAFIPLINIQAQDLEPRSLSAIPTGGNFAVASYGYSTGNILLDNSLPIEDLNSSLNNIVLAYGRSFKSFNHLSKFDVVLPYSFAKFEGEVNNLDSSTYRNGFGDALVRYSLVLVGGKPLNIKEFFAYEQKKFKLGVFARARLPIGNYDPTKLLNLGANRWSLKLGIGASYTFFKRLVVEGHANSWFFSENTEFFNGNSIKQKPLLSFQLHTTYVFKPGVWLAVSVGRSALGETVLNGVEKNDLQNNSRYGAAFAFKLNKKNALKFGITSGITTRYGANFTSILVAYQFMWFDKIKPS